MESKYFWMKKINNIFKFPNESDAVVNDEIEIPTQRNFESSSSSSTLENFEYVENVMNYFNFPKTSALIEEKGKVVLLRLQIKNATCQLYPGQLDELAQKLSENSIVIFLMTKDDKKFFLYWKSKDIKQLLIFKIYDKCDYMNDLKLFEFISTFLADSLKQGYLGLHNGIKINSETTTFGLHLLADHRNYNLLLIAAEKGDSYITYFMLDAGFSTESCDTNAQTLAYNNQHFDILLSLLKANLTYPEMIKIEECPNEIKSFSEISCSLNAAIISKDITKIEEILFQNSELHHFYNLNNESAPAFALRNKQFDMYNLLISKDIKFGPYEKFSKITKKLKKAELEMLREMHYNESKYHPDNHMHVLLSNSRLAPLTTDHRKKYEIIQKSFEILNENPFIKIILMIVAASRNFRIVFDFNRNSIEVMDPTSSANTKGLFYSFGRIYVAAKELLDVQTKFEALGTLAHELCHYAMNLVYDNFACPYAIDDDKTEKEFNEIAESCRQNQEKEKIIKLVYECYPTNMQHAELIVRVPHLMMLYFDNSDQFEIIRNYFIKLFEMFEQKIFQEMNEALPKIEAKAEKDVQGNRKLIRNLLFVLMGVIVLSVTGVMSAVLITRSITEKLEYKFHDLSFTEQTNVRKAPILYKNINLEFQELFPKNSSAYNKLSSDHISQMLHEKILNFTDSRFQYLEDQVTHDWENLNPKLKDKILKSTLVFQNQSLKFEEVLKINSGLLKHLSSSQILDILDEKQLNVHQIVNKSTNFYIDRYVSDEHIFEIYFIFMEYVQGHKMFSCKAYNKINSTLKFSEFYYGFKIQDSFKQRRKIREIKQNPMFKLCSISDFVIKSFTTFKIIDMLSTYKSLTFGFKEIIQIANLTKNFILSGEAGTGKTTFFEELAINIKAKFPTKWVSYIDLKDHKNLYQDVTSLMNVKIMLRNIFKLDSKNQFELQIFEHLFDTSEMILLWNGFDEISPQFSEKVLSILNLIKDNSNIIQFICTRSLYSEKLADNFKSQTYSLVPFDQTNQHYFAVSYLVSKNFSDDKIEYCFGKFVDVEILSNSVEIFNTPQMLKMIVDLISNDDELKITLNLYKIYEKFVEQKFTLWMKTEFSGQFYLTVLKTGFNILKFYQSFALKSELQDHENKLVYFWVLKLDIMSLTSPPELTQDEVSRMGILSIDNPRNFKFAHNTFTEFFIAQYLIENIYNANDDLSSDEELESRLKIFYYCIGNNGVRKFFKSFLKSENLNKSKRFHSRISKLLKSKFQKMFIYPPVFEFEIYEFLFDFFGRDHDVLVKLLQIDESETVYTATFNYVYVEVLKFDRHEIKNLARPYLSDNEFKKFVWGKNRKGIILFSLYCLEKRDKSFYNISHDYFTLDNNLLESDDPKYVFESILKMLTMEELKELLKSDIMFKPIISTINSQQYIFDRNKWNLIESILSKLDQKELIDHIFKAIPPIIDADDIEFLLIKMSELFSNSEIFNMFYNYCIFNYAINFNKTLYVTWRFFVKHTTREQQEYILKFSQDKSCYLIKYPYESCISLNLLFFSFLSFDRNAHNIVVDIYESYFNTTQIQEIILTSNRNTPLLVFMLSDEVMFENLIAYLKEIFFFKTTTLENFLMRPIPPTGHNFIELVKNYRDPWNLIELLTKKGYLRANP